MSKQTTCLDLVEIQVRLPGRGGTSEKVDRNGCQFDFIWWKKESVDIVVTMVIISYSLYCDNGQPKYRKEVNLTHEEVPSLEQSK